MQGKVSHYVFVASAGAYVPDGIHAGAPLVSPFLFLTHAMEDIVPCIVVTKGICC